MFKWLLISIIEWNILGISQIGKKFWMVTTIIRTGYRFSKMCSFLCVTFIKENTCFKYQSGKWYRNKIRFDFIFKNWWLHHNFLWSPQIHFHEQNYLDLSFLKNTIVLYMNKTNSDYYHLWWLCLTINRNGIDPHFRGSYRKQQRTNRTLHHNMECVHFFPFTGTIAGVVISLDFKEWLVFTCIAGTAGSTTARLMLLGNTFSVTDCSINSLLDANFSFSPPKNNSDGTH